MSPIITLLQAASQRFQAGLAPALTRATDHPVPAESSAGQVGLCTVSIAGSQKAGPALSSCALLQESPITTLLQGASLRYQARQAQTAPKNSVHHVPAESSSGQVGT